MVKLSDRQFATLLEEIGCAMRIGAPVADALRRLESRRLGRVRRAARTIIDHLERGERLVDAVSAIDFGGGQCAAAIGACEQSGNGSLIERMAVQLRRRSDFRAETRIAWFYPLVLLAIGYVTAVLVMAPMIRSLHGFDFAWSNPVVVIAQWLAFYWWVPPAVAAIGLVVLVGWLMQRPRFPGSVRMTLFCQTLADQLAFDVADDAAISVAAEISGDPRLTAIDSPSLSSPEVARILSECQVGAVDSVGMSVQQTLIARLRYLGALHYERARHRSYFWARFVPRCSMVVIGGGLTLTYAWWVIAPVYRQVGQW